MKIKIVRFSPSSFRLTLPALQVAEQTQRFSIVINNETINAEKLANLWKSIVILSVNVVNVNYKIPALSCVFLSTTEWNPVFLLVAN